MNLIDVSARVNWPVYLGLGLLCAYLVWVLIAPDRAWRLERAFVGWQYRDGHRIELSTAGRLWIRFCAAVLLVVAAAACVATVDWSAGSRVETEPWPDGGTVYDVGDPVESPGCTVRVFVCLRSDVVFPIEVESYRTIEPETADEPLPEGTNLLLYVEARFFPTHIVVDEGEQVTISVYGKCAPLWRLTGDAYGSSREDCASDTPATLFDVGVVPVGLAEPLGGRTLIDGYRDTPVD